MPITTHSSSDLPSDDQRETPTPNTSHTPSQSTITQAPPPATAAQTPPTNKVSVVQPAALRGSRAGRRPKFSPADELVLVRKVAAAKAHVAPNGETKERFEIAASRANATGKLSCNVTWKSMQDSYKRLQTRFDKRDAEEAAMSGVGGEVGETEELLSSMTEARDDREKEALQKKKAVKDKEAEKERFGAVIRDQSVNRKGARDVVSEGGLKSLSGSDNGETETPRKRRRKTGDSLKEGFEREMHDLTEALTQADRERNRIEEARLQLDRDRFEVEKHEREKDRQERKEERKATMNWSCKSFERCSNLLGRDRRVPRRASNIPSKERRRGAAL